MRTKFILFPLLGGMISLAAGCATLTKGSTDTVSVDTRPPGATCDLSQGGVKVAYVNPTPGSVLLEKSKNDVNVRCEREGYLPAIGTISSEVEAITAGNLLFGGVIGVAVDAASGALNKYPPLVTIVMTPAQFPDEAARNAFFDERAASVETAHKSAVTEAEKTCKRDKDQCERMISEADKARDEAIAALEVQRAQATVAPSGLAPAN